MNKQVFHRWCIALTLIWIFANWPSSSGLGGLFYHAGFPFVFAWGFGHFEQFDALSFGADCVLGVGVVIGVSWLCAWSRSIPSMPPNENLRQTSHAAQS